EAEGYAEFAETDNKAHLEVTFFWPFYADYVVFEVGTHYEYAFVTSDSKDYLWLLARNPIVEQSLIDRFLKIAREGGFKVSDLVFVPQDKYVLNAQISEQQNQASKAVNQFEK
ncbi:MAG: lipocalin family protein, partial [Kangiellaceae bacterium]|nr:lipocalin family protein [Kangiellaceae bacterium]